MTGLGRTQTGASIKSRTNSRSSRTDNSLHRIQSSQFPDDQSVYHGDTSQEFHNDTDVKLPPGTDIERQRFSSRSGESDSSSETELSEKRQNSRQRNRETVADEIGDDTTDARDLEAQMPQVEMKKSSSPDRDPNLITWDGPDDPNNPKQWSMRRKWAAVLIVSAFTLVSPVSSTVIAPALPAISNDFGIKNQVEAQLTLSAFVLAYAIGPLLLGPLSEVYGRTIVVQLSNLFYFAFNLACGFSQTSGQLMAFRFLSGLGGSAPLSVGGGVLSDCFPSERRGRAISIYSLAPLIGPAIGPIAGGYITMNTTWRWCFWATSIFTILVQCLGVLFLQETYAPKLLAQKRDKLRKETGNMELHTEWDDPSQTLSNKLKVAIQRPFRLLTTQPIVQALAVYMAYLYGTMYLTLATFPTLWTNVYHQSIGISSLNYMSMGLGFFIGTQTCAPLNDIFYARQKQNNKNIGKPEFRVPLMLPAACVVPIGLFWYGWSAQAHTHWIMPNIGIALYSAGTIVQFQCMQTYIVDAYTRFAASAIAAAVVLRSLAGFGFPLFAPAMFSSLDYGWGNSVLGFVAVGLGIPAPVMLWFLGPRLRAKSQFAAG